MAIDGIEVGRGLVPRRLAVILAPLALLAGTALSQEAGPAIQHAPISQAVPGQPLTITATIQSAHGVFEPTAIFRRVGDPAWMKQALLPEGEGRFSVTLPGASVTSDLEYYLEAYDDDGNGPARAGGPDAPFRVAVAPAAPGSAAPAAKPAPAAAVSAPVPPPKGDWRPVLGWSALAAGGAALAGGVAFLLSANGQTAAAQASPSASVATKDLASASGASALSTTLFIGGAVLAIGGATLLLLHPQPASPSPDSGAFSSL
ncbi:MAG: hypothetical protein ACYCWW_02045 [Deltaproteobacteria bacterium]